MNNTANFAAYARYYDLLYRDKDYAGEAAYVAALIRKFAPHAKRVLELGCGTGKHANLLAQAGFEVLGIDRSPQMVAQANARAHAGCSFRVGDACEMQEMGGFDVVISLFHVLSYQTQDAHVRAMLNTITTALDVGGIAIFDYWYGPAVLHEKPEKRIKTMESETTKVVRYCTPSHDERAHVVEVVYDIDITDKLSGTQQTLHERHPMRYFFDDELVRFTQQAGLQQVLQEVWLKGTPPTREDFGVVSVARKS